jgi:hypothetical protein
MNWSGRGLAALCGLGALGLVAGGMATAEEEVLEEMLDKRSEGNVDSVASQKRIDALSDESDVLVSEFRTTLKRIDSINLYNEQIRKLIDSQERELASLEEQVGRVQSVGRSVTPLMLKMVDAVEKFVSLDVPFLIDERTERIAELRRTLGRADVTTPEKFRQVMEAYQIENEYGRTIEAYRDTLEIGGREITVDFLRFGRIALVYQSLDETLVGRWDQEARQWVELDGSYRSAFRNGLRISRKQTAPDLIMLPLPAAVEARGDG